MRVLVIEDERQLAGHVARALARCGHSAEARYDGESGIAAVLANPPDLIILDLNMPAMDGLTVLGQLRGTRCTSRVLILTARSEVDHRIKGLRAGADDYLSKPFSMDELIARVEALGRRTASQDPGDVHTVGDLRVDVISRRVNRAGRPITLSPREFEVLLVLVQEPGRTFSRTELCERVWQRDHEYDTRTVEIFITRLRKKVDAGFDTPLIHTLRGTGYTIKTGNHRQP